MSGEQHVYRFATAAQWQRCLLHGFDLDQDGNLAPTTRLGTQVRSVGAEGRVSAVAVDRYGRTMWRTGSTLNWLDDFGEKAGPYEVATHLSTTPRLLSDRQWLWALDRDHAEVRRYDRDSLQLDLSIDVNALCAGRSDPEHSHPIAIIDFAGDGHDGTWLLARSSNGIDWLLHVNCDGCQDRRFRVPCDAGPIIEIGTVSGGASLVLLDADGIWLRFVEAADGTSQRALRLGNLAPCWHAARMTTDGGNRIALAGLQAYAGQTKPIVFLLDGAGDVLDEFPELFVDAPADLAVHRDSLWFATGDGLWRLDASDASGSRESSSTLITPGLYSPTATSERGWLRAEVRIDLPRGAVMKVHYGGTNDERVAAQLQRIAEDESTTVRSRQESVWSLLDTRAAHLVIAGPTVAKNPIAIPLYVPEQVPGVRSPAVSERDEQWRWLDDRWLWLRLEVVTPAGTKPPRLCELRVLYPERSLMQHLPAVFRGPKNDPSGVLRRLVGVLESTTQSIDERIRGIGAAIDPDTAPAEWFDYLARWLNLPWDDALPPAAKRTLLTHAGELLAARGTRGGVDRLLRCLLDEASGVRVVDVTVDHAPLRIGGVGCAGGALPALLAGISPRIATLGGKAALGTARLACRPSDCNPLNDIVPTLQMLLTTTRATRAAVEPLLASILGQYLPVGLKVSVRWRVIPEFLFAAGGTEDDVLDANGPGVLGDDSIVGRTVLVGRSEGRIDDAGLSMGFRLK